MIADDANEVLAAWETSSLYWNKHQAVIEKMFAPLTGALIENSHIGPGLSVLDVGGGSGEPSLTIAPIVGESGSVIYTDPSAGMVETARKASERRGLSNIQFHRCPAEQLPFPDNSFDVATSRLSVMFFPNVLAALAEILRVTKPGGYLSFAVWGPSEVNPFFRLITDILNEFVPAAPEDEDAPGAFRFSRAGKLARLLHEAGATSVNERVLDFRIQAPISVAQFWELRTEMSDTFREKLKQIATERVAEIKEAVEKKVVPYFENGAMNFPAQALVVTGKKPR